MSPASARRRSGLLGAALGALLSPLLLLAAAAPASADAAGATITQPSGSGAIRDRSDVTVAGTVESSNGGTLSLAGGGAEKTGDERKPGEGAGGLACSIDPVNGGCGWSGPLANGSYTIKLTSNAYEATRKCGPGNTQNCKTQYEANTVTRTLLLQVPPATPASVDASNSARVVTVAWAKGEEPDLTHYVVYGNSAELVQVSATNGDACSSSRCSITIDYSDAPDVTGTQSYSVKAYRSDGAGDEVASAMSGSSSVTLPDPPKPSTGGDGGGSGGSTGGTTGGGSGGSGGSGGGSGGSGGSSGGGGSTGGGSGGSGGTTSGGGGTIEEQPTANDGRGGISFSGRPGLGLKFTTSGGTLQIPSLPGSGNPQPHVATPEGTYDPSLPYGDQTAVERSVEKSLGTRLVTSIGDFTTDVGQLLRALAGALILVLIGGHVRQLSRSSRYE